MISLDVADLVVIASRVLDTDTEKVLDLLDVEAAEAALASAPGPVPVLSRIYPARAAAALMHGLLRHRPLRRGNEQVAVLAAAQLLALNGFEVDLEPPEETEAMIASLGAGRMEPTELADWLARRMTLREDYVSSFGDMVRCQPTGLRRRIKSAIQRKDPFRRFTDQARAAVAAAQDEARRLGHNYIGTEHVLLGLLRIDEGVAARALAALDIGLDDMRQRVEQIIGRFDQRIGGQTFTPRVQVVLERSLREAFQLGHNDIGTEHLLLALLSEGEGVGAQILVERGADHARVLQQIIQLLAGESQQQWLDSVDVAIRENHRLRAEVERLRSLLREHGIEPDEPNDGPPQAAQA